MLDIGRFPNISSSGESRRGLSSFSPARLLVVSGGYDDSLNRDGTIRPARRFRSSSFPDPASPPDGLARFSPLRPGVRPDIGAGGKGRLAVTVEVDGGGW